MKLFSTPIAYLVMVLALGAGLFAGASSPVAAAPGVVQPHWQTGQSAQASCDSATGFAKVDGTIMNDEPTTDPSGHDMLISMTRIAPNGSDAETTSVQTVVRQASATFTILTNLSSLPAGTVRFNLEWADHSGTDVRYADFNAVSSCTKQVVVPGQPPSQDVCNPPGVTNNVAWVPVSGPADTSDINWTLNGDGTLTATPQPGKSFPGTQQIYTFTKPADNGVLCPVVTPPPVVHHPKVRKFSGGVDCRCVTEHYGSALVKAHNYQVSTAPIHLVVFVDGNVILRHSVQPGATYKKVVFGLPVGSLIRLFVDRKPVDHQRVPRGCVVPPSNNGGKQVTIGRQAAVG